MVLPSTAMTVLPSMVPARVHNHDLRRLLRSVGSRSCRTRRMVDSEGRAWPAASPRASRSAPVRSVACSHIDQHPCHSQRQHCRQVMAHTPPVPGIGDTPENLGQGPGCLMSRCPRSVFGASCRNARQVEGWLGGFPDSYAFVDVGQDAWDLGEAGAGRACPWPGG